MSNRQISVGTVFSGIGALEHALELNKTQFYTQFACDNDPNVKKSYFANFDISENIWYDNVENLEGQKYINRVDLFAGGSPCQSFSVAGKRKGLEEARGTLFYDFARLVSEIQPRVFIYENVPGMLNHDKGKTWGIISKIFDDLDYNWVHWILNAKHFGLAQNRKRLFVIGFHRNCRDNFLTLESPTPYELNKKLSDYLEPIVDNKYYLPEKGFKRVIDPKHKKHVALNGIVARCQVANQQFNWYGDMRFEDNLSKEISEDDRIYKGYFGEAYGVARCLTPRECLRLMGFSDNFKIVVSDSHMYRQCGNSIAINVLIQIINEITRTGVFQ
jgi:DNA (cytosine-5)-methyltransferase 1